MKLLNSGYLNYSWSENIYTIMWQKLIINSLVNPLTVIYNCYNGNIKDKSCWQNLLKNYVQESVIILDKINIKIASNSLTSAIESIIENTYTNESSMLCDYRNNRETEIKYLNVAICKIALANKIIYPINSIILSAVSTILGVKNDI